MNNCLLELRIETLKTNNYLHVQLQKLQICQKLRKHCSWSSLLISFWNVSIESVRISLKAEKDNL